MSDKLTLREAREIIARAVEKSLEVDWISAYAVADEAIADSDSRWKAKVTTNPYQGVKEEYSG